MSTPEQNTKTRTILMLDHNAYQHVTTTLDLSSTEEGENLLVSDTDGQLLPTGPS